MEIQAFNLPEFFPSEIRKYNLSISQENLSGNASTYISLNITSKNGKQYKSWSYDFSEKLSLPEHLEIVKSKVLDDISKQISEKSLSSKPAGDTIIDISPVERITAPLSKKCKSCKKSETK